MAIYSPEYMRTVLVRVTTTEMAVSVSDQLPSLAKLNLQFGQNKTAALIKLYLIDITELVNLKRPLTEKQIEYIATRVVSDFYNLTIADIHVIFQNLLSGKYGSMYDSLDVPKMLKIFQTYFDERCEICEYNTRATVDDKHGNMTAGRMKEYFDKLEKNIKK